MRKYGKLLMAGMVLMILCGCGSNSNTDTKEYNGSSIVMNEDGSLTEYILEETDQTEQSTQTLDVDELQKFIDSEIADYNSFMGREDAVSCQNCSVEDDRMNVTMDYASCEDYAAFNRVTLFTGTVAEAKAAGYELKLDATTAEDHHVVTAAEVRKMEDSMILITTMPYEIRLTADALYYSNGVELIDNNCVSFLNVDYGYVIYGAKE